jgi:nucleoside-diphosphate-sugar epimerase
MASVVLSGGTGYIGQRLVPALLARGHDVRVLARPQSLTRVPARARAVAGDALDAASVAAAVRPEDTLVHLVGTPHPSPSKAAEFQAVDLPAARASIAAAAEQRIAHFVYVSVAHPAPVMEAYIASRVAAEAAIAEAGLTATVLRPWYVLGPGHRWPIALIPVYWILRTIPSTRAGAARLGLVTIDQMIAALVRAVEHPPLQGTMRIVAVPEIRQKLEPGT